MPTCVLICIRDRPIIRSDINHYSSSLLSVCSKANTVSPVTQVIASQHRMIWMYWGWWYTCCWTTRPRRQPPSCWHTCLYTTRVNEGCDYVARVRLCNCFSCACWPNYATLLLLFMCKLQLVWRLSSRTCTNDARADAFIWFHKRGCRDGLESCCELW